MDTAAIHFSMTIKNFQPTTLACPTNNHFVTLIKNLEGIRYNLPQQIESSIYTSCTGQDNFLGQFLTTPVKTKELLG